jgi:hypothetical protein
MNKKVFIGLVVLIVVAISTVFVLALNNQNPNNAIEQNDVNVVTTNSNPYFDIQVKMDSARGISLILVNKQMDKYLDSHYEIEVNNGNKNSADGRHISLDTGSVGLDPNQTCQLFQFPVEKLEACHVFDQKPYLIQTKLTLDSYGTVNQVTELRNVERLGWKVDFPEVGIVSITLKNYGVDPFEISAIRIGTQMDYQNSGNLQNSPLTLQGNETVITELGFDWVNGEIYYVNIITSKGNSFLSAQHAP